MSAFSAYSVVHRPLTRPHKPIYARKRGLSAQLSGQGASVERPHTPVVPEMAKRPSVKRIVKAALDAGLEVARVEVGADGRIVVVAGKPGNDVTAFENPWDQVLDHAQEQKRAS